MSDYQIFNATLSSAADAIRGKYQNNDPVPCNDMANIILNINCGYPTFPPTFSQIYTFGGDLKGTFSKVSWSTFTSLESGFSDSFTVSSPLGLETKVGRYERNKYYYASNNDVPIYLASYFVDLPENVDYLQLNTSYLKSVDFTSMNILNMTRDIFPNLNYVYWFDLSKINNIYNFRYMPFKKIGNITPYNPSIYTNYYNSFDDFKDFIFAVYNNDFILSNNIELCPSYFLALFDFNNNFSYLSNYYLNTFSMGKSLKGNMVYCFQRRNINCKHIKLSPNIISLNYFYGGYLENTLETLEVIDNEGLIALSDIGYAFSDCINLTSANIIIDTITPYINYFNMWYAFHNCSNLQIFPTIKNIITNGYVDLSYVYSTHDDKEYIINNDMPIKIGNIIAKTISQTWMTINNYTVNNLGYIDNLITTENISLHDIFYNIKIYGDPCRIGNIISKNGSIYSKAMYWQCSLIKNRNFLNLYFFNSLIANSGINIAYWYRFEANNNNDLYIDNLIFGKIGNVTSNYSSIQFPCLFDLYGTGNLYVNNISPICFNDIIAKNGTISMSAYYLLSYNLAMPFINFSEKNSFIQMNNIIGDNIDIQGIFSSSYTHNYYIQNFINFKDIIAKNNVSINFFPYNGVHIKQGLQGNLIKGNNISIGNFYSERSAELTDCPININLIDCINLYFPNYGEANCNIKNLKLNIISSGNIIFNNCFPSIIDPINQYISGDINIYYNNNGNGIPNIYPNMNGNYYYRGMNCNHFNFRFERNSPYNQKFYEFVTNPSIANSNLFTFNNSGVPNMNWILKDNYYYEPYRNVYVYFNLGEE